MFCAYMPINFNFDQTTVPKIGDIFGQQSGVETVIKSRIKSGVKSGTMSEIKRADKLEALVRYTDNQRVLVINHLSNITQSI